MEDQQGRSEHRERLAGGGTTPPAKVKRQRSETKEKTSPFAGLASGVVSVFTSAASPSKGKSRAARSSSADKNKTTDSGKRREKNTKSPSRTPTTSPAHRSKTSGNANKSGTARESKKTGKMEKPGGKDFACLPPGAKASDFERPEGAGTDFVLDLGPPKTPAKNNPGGPKKVDVMEMNGGQNFATLPAGAKATDFAQPTEAGTGFSLDLTPNKTAGKSPHKVGAMEMEGGKNLACLPPGAKATDFAQPTAAGTDFVLDLAPAATTPPACKTAYHEVTEGAEGETTEDGKNPPQKKKSGGGGKDEQIVSQFL